MTSDGVMASIGIAVWTTALAGLFQIIVWLSVSRSIYAITHDTTLDRVGVDTDGSPKIVSGKSQFKKSKSLFAANPKAILEDAKGGGPAFTYDMLFVNPGQMEDNKDTRMNIFDQEDSWWRMMLNLVHIMFREIALMFTGSYIIAAVLCFPIWCYVGFCYIMWLCSSKKYDDDRKKMDAWEDWLYAAIDKDGYATSGCCGLRWRLVFYYRQLVFFLVDYSPSTCIIAYFGAGTDADTTDRVLRLQSYGPFDVFVFGHDKEFQIEKAAEAKSEQKYVLPVKRPGLMKFLFFWKLILAIAVRVVQFMFAPLFFFYSILIALAYYIFLVLYTVFVRCACGPASLMFKRGGNKLPRKSASAFSTESIGRSKLHATPKDEEEDIEALERVPFSV
jgi:hypothetical protein